MRISLQRAFIVHRRAYRETSLQLEVFSREYGRIGLIAKGANRPKSSLRAALHAFTPLLLSWVGRSELGVLTAAEGDGPFLPLAGRHLLSAFYLNELLMRLLQRHDPHPGLFDGYALALTELANLALGEARALRRFEKLLLEQLGYGLLLNKDIRGVPVAAELEYYYRVDQGPARTAADAGSAMKISGATLLALAAGEFASPTVEREARNLMRYVLGHYLGDKPLHSRELFRKSSGNASTTPDA